MTRTVSRRNEVETCQLKSKVPAVAACLFRLEALWHVFQHTSVMLGGNYGTPQEFEGRASWSSSAKPSDLPPRFLLRGA